jgi:histidine triad (HIT) family protein
MEECIFCKIVKGEIPSNKVYEDDDILAFLDIAPVNPGHTLVIPKTHYKNLEEIPKDLLANLILVVKKVGLGIKKGIPSEGYNIGLNNDPASGQVVPHLHFHIIPRKTDDGLRLWPQKDYSDGEAIVFTEKIRKNIY